MKSGVRGKPFNGSGTAVADFGHVFIYAPLSSCRKSNSIGQLELARTVVLVSALALLGSLLRKASPKSLLRNFCVRTFLKIPSVRIGEKNYGFARRE